MCVCVCHSVCVCVCVRDNSQVIGLAFGFGTASKKHASGLVLEAQGRYGIAWSSSIGFALASQWFQQHVVQHV